ncbi:hypothetical protein [Devosia sp. CAU 1758]
MRLAASLVTLFATLFTFWAQVSSGLNPDVSWLLTVGERMLDGQQLYTDIHELNPPMSALLYLPMVVLGRWLGLPPEPLVVGAILLLTLVCLRGASKILRRGDLLGDPGLWWIIGVMVMIVFPGVNFGEREHVALILMLPLLAVGAVRQQGGLPGIRAELLAGLAAGLVMTIKPHFALPILLVALYGAAWTRSWRPMFNPAHVVAGLVLIAYGLVVLVWFSSFFTEMLPVASAAYVGDRWPPALLVFGLPTLPFWLMLAGLLLLYRREVMSPPKAPLLVASIGFFLVYIIQGKGFVYHLLPGNALAAMVLAQCFIERNGQGARRQVLLVLAVVVLSFPGLMGLRGDPVRIEVMAALRPLGPGLAIANLTAHLSVASPLHRQLDATLVNAGPCLWITLGATRRSIATDDAGVQAQMRALEAWERARLGADLSANPPDIILAGADRFDWISWARQDADLAVLLDGYELMVTLGPEATPLEVWRRL